MTNFVEFVFYRRTPRDFALLMVDVKLGKKSYEYGVK